jgi:aspartate aminotransferase
MLAPATGFYGTVGLGKMKFVWPMYLNLEAITAALDCLEHALKQYREE